MPNVDAGAASAKSHGYVRLSYKMGWIPETSKGFCTSGGGEKYDNSSGRHFVHPAVCKNKIREICIH